MEDSKQEVILELVSRHFGIDKDVILSKKRVRDVAMAKQMLSFLFREHCGMTFTKIADTIGAATGYDHSTVIYGCRRMRSMIFSRETPAYDIYKSIMRDLGEEKKFTIHPKLIIRYPKGFNIQEVIQLINAKHKNLEYEFI